MTIALPKSFAAIALLLACLVPAWAEAGIQYYKSTEVSYAKLKPYEWAQITLPASTGATCGNGTPYRFYVQKGAPQNSNLLVSLEGGGACWNYGTCTSTGTNAEAGYGPINPDGIPDGYINDWMGYFSTTAISPVSSRFSSFFSFILGTDASSFETKDWNYTYFPYCTGDLHAGSATRVYVGPDNQWKAQYFRGKTNVDAALAWMKSSGAAKPDRLLVFGVSAGGYGSLVNYGTIRDALKPQRSSSALSDAGTVLPVTINAATEKDPATYMYRRISQEWGWDDKGGLYEGWNRRMGRTFDKTNFATFYTSLSKKYPKDRFGLMTFQQDQTIAGYHFIPLVPEMAGRSDEQRMNYALANFTAELYPVREVISTLPNFGYFMPWKRGAVKGDHGVTLFNTFGTFIYAQGAQPHYFDQDGYYADDFVYDILSQRDPAEMPVMKAETKDEYWYSSWTSRTSVFGWLLDWFI